MPSAVACEAMCRPSASSAMEPYTRPATISTTIITAVTPTTSSVRASPARL